MKKAKDILLAILGSKIFKYGLVIIIGVAVVGFMDENSIYSHLKNKEKIAELKAEIERNRENHRRDEAKVHALETDPKAVEKVAREKHLMKMPDEDIFVIRNSQND